MKELRCANRVLDLNKPHIMGILNVTPDSFSDGGSYFDDRQLSLDKAVQRAAEMVAEGATLIDVGGESTRPGAEQVTQAEELDRVVPVVERIAAELDVVISVDSSDPVVFRESAAAGAGMFNDVRALGREGAVEAAAATGLPVCLMHMQGSPATMQDAPAYEDVLDEVSDFLLQRVEVCLAAGIDRNQLILDPGFGFGKTLEHNLRLLNNLQHLHQHGFPLLIGTSRKTMIGAALDRDVDQRLYGSLATVASAVMQGAEIIRVHDVAATCDVVRMTRSIMQESKVN